MDGRQTERHWDVICVTLYDSYVGTSVNLSRGTSYGPKCLREALLGLSFY